MNAETKAVSKLDFKKRKAKKRKTKRYRSVKFDKKRFSLVLGVGIVSVAIGLWIIWATKTATEGISQSISYTTAQRIAHILPESTKEILAFISGNLFVLFGVVCIFICLNIVVQYIADKLKN